MNYPTIVPNIQQEKKLRKKKTHTNKQINKVTKFKRIEIYSSSTVHIHFHLIDFATQVDV